MAVPKRKVSKSRRDNRRAHKKTHAPNLSTCPQCGEARLPHHVCPGCGSYRGRTVVESEEE
ncbi:MAG: 50S ribosomal protein L32 [Deltaproteobacteria bacterium]|nr:50S ribosomal protein L32 [Deltaproteobacteria bacterium]MBW2153879.1 50S ribosomal protein L32 [Deltaproteobacteria bacterium]